jgi:hypothetical protein
MQTQGVPTAEAPIGVGHFICKQASDFDSLETAITNATAAYVLANPDAQLIDLSLAGGGAGNVFMATMLFVPGSIDTPLPERFVSMVVKYFTASDQATLQSKMNAYLGTLGGTIALWAWETSCAGNGAVWIAILVTYNPNPG